MPPELLPWVVLAVVVGSMLALDLLVLHRDARPVAFREAARWSVVWVALSLCFGAFIALLRGGESGSEYLAGYLIELSLSVDNVFVFALIFTAFAVPAAYQHRLLFWGILGAIVFRALFIAAGTAVLAAAHWVLYLLGVLLVVTGIRLARSRGHAIQPEKNPVLRLFRRFVPMTDDYRGPAFVVREGGRWIATPLLAVLVAIETTDIMFALDSIPAVFAVTTDPLIVFSSNLFAIVGLRSLYFLLAGLLDRFVYLKVGLAALLVFAGVKILIGSVYKMPIALSLGVIVAILGIAILGSLLATHPRRGGLVAPAVRIVTGVLLGLSTTGSFIAVAAIRDGEAWPVLLGLVVVATAAATMTAGGIVGIRRNRYTQVSAAAVRVGSGVLLGLAMTLALAGLAVMLNKDSAWVALDAGLAAAAVGAVMVGHWRLHGLRARAALVRGWATVGATVLLILALFIALD